MAGESGGRWYVVSEAVQPCCLDNVIIEFRLIEQDADKDKDRAYKSMNKSFGFDWLRGPQDKALVRQETPYVSADYDPGVTGSVRSGFKRWSTEELKAMADVVRLMKDDANEQDATKKKIIEQKIQNAGDIIARHVDLTGDEAQAQMIWDYSGDIFPLIRESQLITYRWRKYYVPRMTLFPPIDKLMSESSIEVYAQTLVYVEEEYLSDKEKCILKKTKEIEARKAKEKEQGKNESYWPSTTLLEATNEYTKYSGTCSKATLRLLKDIKMEPPEKISIEYDDRYLKVSIEGSSEEPEKVLNYDMNHLVELTLPKSCYAVNYKIEEISDLRITIEAIDEFAADQELVVYALTAGDPVRRIAGKLIVCANDSSKRKNVEIALVQVTTYIKAPNKGLEGNIRGTEVENLRRVLHQALITADIKRVSKHVSGEFRPHRLDLKSDHRFNWPPAPSAQNNSGNQAINPEDGMYIKDGALNHRKKNFGVTLEKAFLKEFPQMVNHFLVFAFGDDGTGGLAGNADYIAWPDESGGYYCHFKQTCFLYHNRDDFGDDDYIMAHEFLHTLKLTHTHRDGTAALRAHRTRYLFDKGSLFLASPMATNNVMSYNEQSMRWQTWRWQWEIMQAHTGIEGRENFSGYVMVLPNGVLPSIDVHAG